MKLISMTDFVLEQEETRNNAEKMFWLCLNYANFLKQPLTLGMFVPCDLEGKHFIKPEEIVGVKALETKYIREVNAYQQAKDRVLFEGVDISMQGDKITAIGGWCLDILERDTIEDLVTLTSATLTPTALKQIGL